jgi:prepilin peptidase CpaA
VEQAPFYVGAGIIASIALYTDTRRGLIPNWLTFPTLLAGLVLHGVVSGGDGLLLSAQGAGLGLGLFLIPFLLGGMGAGDVKLLAALGAFVGPEHIFATFVFSAILGGIIGAVCLVRRFGWQATGLTVLEGWTALLSPTQFRTRLNGFPFASAILFGLFASLLVV